MKYINFVLSNIIIYVAIETKNFRHTYIYICNLQLTVTTAPTRLTASHKHTTLMAFKSDEIAKHNAINEFLV